MRWHFWHRKEWLLETEWEKVNITSELFFFFTACVCGLKFNTDCTPILLFNSLKIKDNYSQLMVKELSSRELFKASEWSAVAVELKPLCLLANCSCLSLPLPFFPAICLILWPNRKALYPKHNPVLSPRALGSGRIFIKQVLSFLFSVKILPLF